MNENDEQVQDHEQDDAQTSSYVTPDSEPTGDVPMPDATGDSSPLDAPAHDSGVDESATRIPTAELVAELERMWPQSNLVGDAYLVLKLSEPEALVGAQAFARAVRGKDQDLFIKLAGIVGLNVGRV